MLYHIYCPSSHLVQGLDEDEDADDLEALEGEVQELEGRIAAREKRKKEIQQRRAWNIDNICRTKEEKSLINRPDSKPLEADEAPDLEAADDVDETATEALSDQGSPSVPAAKAAVPKSQAAVSREATAQSEAAKPVPVGPSTEARERFAAISYNDFAIRHEDLLEQYSEVTPHSVLSTVHHFNVNRSELSTTPRTFCSNTATSCCTSTPRHTCCSAAWRTSSTASTSE